MKVPPSEKAKWEDFIKLHRGNGIPSDTSYTTTVYDKKTIKGLIQFLNAIKDTYFNTESKFNSFVEILNQHLTKDGLADLEAQLNESI